MRNLVIITLLIVCTSIVGKAQVLDPQSGPSVWTKERVQKSDPVDLPFVRESDVMYTKRIWRTIDLREKQNLALYFPLDSSVAGRRSFVQLIFDEVLKAAANPGPDALKIYLDDQITTPVPGDQVMAAVSKTEKFQTIVNPETCETKSSDIVLDFSYMKPKIVKIDLMEDWFFDKERSVMDVRILAIGIEIPSYTAIDQVDPVCGITTFGGWSEVDNGNKTIWFYYPDLRKLLASNESFNRFNDAARMSFDDIFLSRSFSGYIVKESNVYNRYIQDYKNGLDALLEAEKISNGIRQYEMDLWEY